MWIYKEGYRPLNLDTVTSIGKDCWSDIGHQIQFGDNSRSVIVSWGYESEKERDGAYNKIINLIDPKLI